MNILFTCSGRRNYLLGYFQEIIGVRVVACDAEINAPTLYEADEFFIVPAITDKDYVAILLSESIKRKINAIISLNDLELPVLASSKRIFKEIGIEVIVSGENVIDICSDKYKTYEFSRNLQLLPIPTFLNPAEAIAYQMQDPDCMFIIKPRWGSASIGLEFPENRDELEYMFRKVQKTIDSSILARINTDNRGSEVIIQKRIFGQEYGMDVVNNLDGDFQETMVRKKIAMRSGETDKAITVIDERISKIGQEIGKKLKHVGNLDCDLFIEDDKVYLLEMNPRFGGGYPFMHIAGANLPLALVKWIGQNNAPNNAFMYKEGIISAKVDRMIMLDKGLLSS